MYTLSRKVIIRKWEPGRHIGPFSLPFLIYSI